jgi:hypothetical protein
MISWLAKRILARNMARLRAGDPGPLLRMDAPDVRFRFPGTTSWSGEIHGKEALEAWLRRFAAVGLQIAPAPWKGTICVRGRVWLPGPDGDLVYDNRYVIWGHTAWGRMKDYEVYEDTQRSVAQDEHLAGQGAA